VNGAGGANVIWSVNDIVNGAGFEGTIDKNGLYTAPSTLSATPITIKATSGTAVAAADLTLSVSSGTASGSTAIIPGLVNGQIVDKAYVPLPSSDAISVINMDAASNSAGVVATIATNLYSPNATAADPITQQIVAISYTSSTVQLIDSSKDQVIASLDSGISQSTTFSGGSCVVCGVAIDPTSNTAILDTAQGYLTLNLLTQKFSSLIAGENFGYNPNNQIALNPTYFQAIPPGLQAINLATNSVYTFTGTLDSEPDSAAIDLQTNIAVVPDEDTGNQFLINMKDAAFTSSTFSAPMTVYNLGFTNCIAPSATNEWTMASIEASTHFLFLGTEFGDCAAVEPLPTAAISGAPPTPTTFKWGHMPVAPDNVAWDNGADPHGITVFTSIVDGKAYGFLVRSDQAWVARIDLAGVVGAPLLSGGIQGQLDLTPLVSFIKTQ
jgi:hypothetical protein